MENNYELKNIKTEKEEDARRYTLSFSNGKMQDNITLVGKGKIKETVKI